MFKHTFRGFLFAPAGETPAGAGPAHSPSSDMGMPHEIDNEPAPAKPAAAQPEKSDVEKRLDALERDNKAKDARISELTQSEQYWANRARGAATPEVPADDPDEEPPPVESPFEGEKPEQLLDDLSVNGLKALHKRGVITTDQLVDELGKVEKRLEQKLDARLAQNQRHQAVDTELAKFPDLLADSKLVAAGQAPKSEHYKRTQVHFQQMVADDANMRNSPAALLAAARMAKKELDLEAKAAGGENTNRQQTRRERIAAQSPERDSGSGELENEGSELSPQAREIVGHLSQFLTKKDGKGNVTLSAEDNYRRHARNGAN